MVTEKELSDEELNSLTTAIKNRYGIDFTNYESKSLKRGFARLMMKKKMDTVLDLWSKILRDREFFMSCIDDLTVNLTELFRNPEIWVKILNEILPLYKSKPDLSIWHAGCSSGEEVYTMAIILKNAAMLSRAKLLATDLSSRILAQAITGEYSSLLMSKYATAFESALPNSRIQDSFTHEHHKAVVKDDLKKRVEFRQHNLVHDNMDRKFDIIFCRNVMIYFDDVLKMKVLKLFYESLQPKGFFIIGYYDMIPAESSKYFELYDAKTRIYRKK